MSSDLSLEFLRVVEQAAIACAHTMGQGDRHESDHAAVEAMRRTLDDVPIDGTIVIGEGERDEAPMLFIGEKVGQATRGHDRACRRSTSRSIRSRARTSARPARPTRSPCSRRPSRADCCTRPTSTWRSWSSARARKHAVSLDRPVKQNLQGDREVRSTARSRTWSSWCSSGRGTRSSSRDIRAAGARIRLIGDGDLSAGIAAAVDGSGVHAVMGTGGAPEGVLTAAAMRCLSGEIFARLVVTKPEHEARCRAMGITDFRRIYSSADLASGEAITFVATGVTDGALMKGVRFFGDGTRTSSIVMQNEPHQIRFIDTIHVDRTDDDLRIRFYRGCGHAGVPRPPIDPDWRRNQAAVTVAVFIGFTGFTLVMPFLPLYFEQLGVHDAGRDRDLVGPQPRRDAGGHGADGAAVGAPRRSLRPQAHGRALARRASSSSCR